MNKKQIQDPILAALKRQKVMTLAELKKHGASGQKLRRMAAEGLIISVGSGIYSASSFDPFVAAVIATAKYYPQSVISNLTALQIHGLSQEYINKIDVDVSRNTSIRNKMLNVHRVPQSRLIGSIYFKYKGSIIKIYDRERCLCEAYRLDPMGSLFFKALKRYLKSGKVKADRIQHYDKAVKTAVLVHLRQELSDD
jgi:hypothetical protein